jgi:hypothetical protein
MCFFLFSEDSVPIKAKIMWEHPGSCYYFDPYFWGSCKLSCVGYLGIYY